MKKNQNQKKIRVIDNEYYRQKVADKERTTTKNKQLKRHKLIMRTIMFAAIVVLGVGIFQTGRNLWQAHAVKQQTQTAQKNLKKITKENSSLKIRVKQLNNQDYLEKLIREKYYYSKDGETIYNLPTESSSSSASSTK
ncbi:FtsB family cell division protein [Ligilactobacillus apodemi]|uniref:Cell division protein DIVIC n=1 Tax=Ligilactobacillus apodemi DSM 16634 = JCM 16172 TaxID=1423724 RepID=A0A0R1U0S5_9LACO|nr:septum formation initiator family protein [Ligilactobacillus apodemi]KRL87088.1 hypothetical protein FC32_GL000381 [Ligilactobacillus apodemi DSM 16634 = JCM 16172]MCR1901341.1 septum formation initiator family protein [Ligilactobacillus apodemi]